MEPVLNRFLRYAAINTQSDPHAAESPTTPGQKELLALLAGELAALGAVVDYDGACVYATLPATVDCGHALGFLAHVDTSPDAPGKDVHPNVVHYDGGDIVLCPGTVLSAAEFPDLKKYAGQDIVVTDGATLLGADDKAGVAEIMALCERLSAPDAPPHCEIKIAFTPDEEIGRGTERFDLKRFGATWAYTVDGGELGEIQYENFNAAAAVVTLHGKSVHPGSAKGVMKNAAALSAVFQSLLPADETPETTEGYEGFFHLHAICGSCESCRLEYLIRDHDRAAFERRKDVLRIAAQKMDALYGPGTATVEITDSYYNMKEQILPHFHLVKNACDAFTAAGISPLVTPIRGGTDGALLSHMGLPCPNLSTGGHNFHGRLEYLPVKSLSSMVDVLTDLVRRYSTVGNV